MDRRVSGRLVDGMRTDAVLAVVLAGLSILFTLTRHASDGPRPGLLSIALILVACTALLWRRRHPVLVLGVVMAAEFLQAGLNYPGTGWIALVVAGFSLGAWARPNLVVPLGLSSSIAVAGFVTLGWLATDNVPWQHILSSAVVYVAAVLLGDNVRRRREATTNLVERAERAERERELLADQLVRNERTRLARELHDVVAHSVTVMTIQAAGARRQLPEHPHRAAEAMETIEVTGREAMTEMRRILGVLRDNAGGADQVSTTPQPQMAELADLVQRSGLPATLVVEGDVSDVPLGVELSAYRIVQEAVTNIGRHAGPVDQVGIFVRRTNGTLTVEVVDDGRGAAADRREAGSGHGLVGMRERVTMLDGRLIVGPRQGGGWRVRAVIPVAG